MDSSTGMNSGQDVSSSTPVLTPSAEVSTPTPSSDVVSEKTFTQGDVNDIVKRAKTEAVERDRRLRTEQPEYAQKKYGDNFNQTQTNQGENGQNYQNTYQSNNDQIRQIVAEESRRQREAWEQENLQKSQQEQAQGIVNKFLSKIEAGKEKYEDFDQVTGDIEFGRFPNTVQLLAEHIENSADVLYELGKDRFKMAQLESLSYMSPNDAIKQAQRLAASIKQNEDATRVRLPNEPLSQLRPSTTGTDSGQVPSMRELKAKYRT